MTPKTDHPFQPGVAVAIRNTSHHSFSTWITATVGKVYKTGNFVLVTDPGQQWRPTTFSRWGKPARHCAYETARAYSRKTLYLLSDVKEEMAEDRAASIRHTRLMKVRDRIQRTRSENFTESMLDAIEAALAQAEEQNGKNPDTVG